MAMGTRGDGGMGGWEGKGRDEKGVLCLAACRSAPGRANTLRSNVSVSTSLLLSGESTTTQP